MPTDLTSFQAVTNGDSLYQGYFNEIFGGIGRLPHFVSHDMTSAGTSGSGDTLLAAHTLTSAETDFDVLVFFVRGTTKKTTSKGSYLKIDPPSSAARIILQSYGGTAASPGTYIGSSFTLLIAATDYTKGAGGTFNIIGTADMGGDNNVVYHESCFFGINLTGG